jgi:hypothetical protein
MQEPFKAQMSSDNKLVERQARASDHDYDDYDDVLDDDEVDDVDVYVNGGEDSGGGDKVVDVQSSSTIRAMSPTPLDLNDCAKKKISALEWVGHKVRRKAAIRRHRLLSVNSFKKYKIDWSVCFCLF